MSLWTQNRNHKALARQRPLRIERLEARIPLDAGIGEMMRTTAVVDVRSQPGFAATEIHTQQYPFYRGSAPVGQLGAVIEGPRSQDARTWWRVDFGPGKYAGWVTGDVLATTTIPYTRGIDVSHWQNQVNWGSVKNFGIEFAFMKATEGTDFVDPRFQQNVVGSRNAGLLVGFYHFGHPLQSGDIVGDARAEAAHFVSVAGPHIRAPGLPPVLDLENRGLDGQPPNRAAISAWARAWLTEVERLTGIRPMVYANSDWAKNYIEPSLKQYELWHARWTRDLDQPPLPTDPGIWAPDWTFWQYSDATLVPGVAAGAPGVLTGVDGDVFAGSLAELQAWAREAVPEPLSAVTDLAAAAVAANQIRLSWTDSVADEDGFYVERSSDGVSFNQVATLGPGATSYNDSLLQSSRQFSYRIRAFRALHQGPWSNMTQATTPQLATITGTSAGDTFRVLRSGTLLKIYENTEPVGQPTYSSEISALGPTLTIDTRDGNDAVVINSGGEVTAGFAQLIYNSGGGDNALVLQSGSARIDSTVAAIGSLTISVQAGAHLSTNRLVGNNLIIGDDSQVTLLADGGTSVINNLGVGAGATLDIANNALVIDYASASPVGSIRQHILSGRGGSGLGATWTGAGITSSTAAQANLSQPEARSIAYAENALLPLGALATFRGQPVDGTSVLIAYTRTGDANLDGMVNDDDVTIIGASYAPGLMQPAGSAWALGDFDYNGFVDDDDVTLLGAFYRSAEALEPPGSNKASQRNIDVELIQLLAESIATNQRHRKLGSPVMPRAFS